MLKLSICALGVHSNQLLYPFDIYLSFFFSVSSFFFSVTGCFRLIQFFPCLRPGISLFSKEAWFFKGTIDCRNQIWVLSVLIASGVSLLIGPPNGKIYIQKCIHAYIYVHSHTCTHTYLYPSIYSKPFIPTDTSSTPCSLHSCPICNSTLQSEKPGSHYPKYILLICSILEYTESRVSSPYGCEEQTY